ncbi:MAG: ATP-binding protein [Bacteroidales bacterium]|jgi:hypothetical protein|nr:ATP-binding protein [Bacteroidales bacterium]
MKKLPIGIQSFEKLRSNGYLYVDKTREIHRMIDSGKIYFLSRPRRFGKSLLVSTLDELFSGNQSLFEGLYIHDRWDWTQPHPVIRLDWGGMSYHTPEALSRSLADFVTAKAEYAGITLEDTGLSDRFFELVEKLHYQTGRKVVLLVDEYDKPITDHLTNPDVLSANDTKLHDFYQVFKAADDHLQFVFLTGISRFSGVSIFSALNLNDITMNDRYASICGYTQEELESYFPEYMDEAGKRMDMSRGELLEDIRRWYNGYSWDGETSVYNPISILLLFDKCVFGNYWFDTGTPTFLISLLQKRNDLKPVLEPVSVSSSALRGFDPLRIGGTSLLFQSGYLTVKSRQLIGGRPQYTLGVPNTEVNEPLLKHLLIAYSGYPADRMPPIRSAMQQQISSGDASGLERNLRILLADVPCQLHVESEAYYHSMLLVWLKTLGFDIQGEISVSNGRIDAVWRQPELTVITEVKYHPEKDAETLLHEALVQIRNRRYGEPYRTIKVTLLAVAFAGKEIACRIEEPEVEKRKYRKRKIEN